PRGRGTYPWTLRLANAALARELRRRLAVPIHDCGPVRAARRSILLGLDLHDRRSGYPVETLVRAARAGLRVRQVDVAYLPQRGRPSAADRDGHTASHRGVTGGRLGSL